MKAFVVTAGVVFALLAAAHLVRLSSEPALAREPWFWLTTVVSGALSAWAWTLVNRRRRGD